MKCPKCQYENKEGALTCNLCGEMLKKDADPDQFDVHHRGEDSLHHGGKTCPNHPGKPIAGFCDACRKDFCSECLMVVDRRRLCPACRRTGVVSTSQFLSHKGAGAIDKWAKIIGVALIINYFIPLKSFMGQTDMSWGSFEISFWDGFVSLLPALCGVILLVLPMLSHGIFRGVAISIVGLIVFLIYTAKSSNTNMSSNMSNSFESNNLLMVFGVLAFILMLAGARLRMFYEKNDIARFLGGVAAIAFLIIAAIQIVQTASIADIGKLLSIPFNTETLGFLGTLTWIIYVICLLCVIVSAILSAINLGGFDGSKSIANASFKTGLISFFIIIGWTLLIVLIGYFEHSEMLELIGGGWLVFFIYRLAFIIGSLLFMFGAGTVDWIRRLMPLSPR
ncbi:MAG: hypothetical protein HY811_10670 [Planctomycetes bacterium]|nr:hypothetical protein [Planctomycetota bacterium]